MKNKVDVDWTMLWFIITIIFVLLFITAFSINQALQQELKDKDQEIEYFKTEYSPIYEDEVMFINKEGSCVYVLDIAEMKFLEIDVPSEFFHDCSEHEGIYICNNGESNNIEVGDTIVFCMDYYKTDADAVWFVKPDGRLISCWEA